MNPTLKRIDRQAVRRAVDQLHAGRPLAQNIRSVVDHTLATPYCQRPVEHGADLVVHILAKDIAGFGTETGGALIGGSA